MLDMRSETDFGSCQAARIRFVANYTCQVATVEVRRLVDHKLLQLNMQFLKSVSSSRSPGPLVQYCGGLE